MVGAGREHARSKLQKEKDLLWLEKELQKIEREKHRLEREKEKFLEREARLEKMRRAMGASGQSSGREVVIQTSSGPLRFEGISEKFTRRLYEWEKARGIGPEASTFALLDPGYRPSRTAERPPPALHGAAATSAAVAAHTAGSPTTPVAAASTNKGAAEGEPASGLARSKSAGSVAASSSCTMTRQASSLSLNDAPTVTQADAGSDLEESRASSEPRLAAGDGNFIGQGGVMGGSGADDGPAAVIVDVEDVVEETAAPLAATPAVRGHTPVYCYAPAEVTRLIDSSGSDSDRDRDRDRDREAGSSGVGGGSGGEPVSRTDSVRTEASCKLLDENMSLLCRFRAQEDICRKIENELENLGDKMDDVAKSHEEELERLRREEKELSSCGADDEADGKFVDEDSRREHVMRLQTRIRELERHRERLRKEGVSLQDSFAEHSEKQAALAQNIVGNLKQLQASGTTPGPGPGPGKGAVRHVQKLSSQLLQLAEKMEVVLAERNREVHSLRWELQAGRTRARGQLSQSLGSLAEPEGAVASSESSEGRRLPRQSSEELSQLPALLTSKVLELKRGLACLCPPSIDDSSSEHPPTPEDEPSATYLVRTQAITDARVEGPIAGDASPVSVTVVPAFWRRSSAATPSATSSATATIATTAPSAASENRHSYCSAVSSTASEDEDEAEDEAEAETEGHDESEDGSERAVGAKTLAASQHSESESDSEDDNKTDYSTGTTVRRPSSGDLVEDPKDAKENFETEVTKCSVPPARVRKLLKTRRISDSHVGYTCPGESRRSGDFSELGPADGQAQGAEPEASEEKGPAEGVSVPSNVFVQTTRKIFSPVRRDSKGKASSVISYVVGEAAFRDFSPVSSSPWKQRDAEAEAAAASSVAAGGPAWMLRRSRSQSSSPALPRRQPAEGAASVTTATPRGSNSDNQGVEGATEKTAERGDSGVGGAPGGGGGSDGGSSSGSKNALNQITDSEDGRGRAVVGATYKEPTSPGTSGFPPLPHSPSPVRRDLFKVTPKEAAPSIRMMIAKYNQKLSAAEAGGRSQEVTGSGHSSPVAWRSPVAERRVRAQSEKYQQEVQKSASAGVIRGGPCPPSPSPADRSPRLGLPRGILKSSSAGAIRPQTAQPAPDVTATDDKDKGHEGGLAESQQGPTGLSAPSSPEISTCPGSPTTPGSPESPLPGRLRALRLKKAKEEFLTRGPGGRSWLSDLSPASPSDDPFEGPKGRNRLSQVSVGSECSADGALEQLLVKSASAGALTAADRFERALQQPGGSLPHSRTEAGTSASGDSGGALRASPAPSCSASTSKQSGSKFGISSITSRFRKVKMRKGKEKEGPRMSTVSQLCRQSLLVDLHLSKGSAGELSGESSSCAGDAAAAASAPAAGGASTTAPAPSSKSCPSSPVLHRPTPTPVSFDSRSQPSSPPPQPPLARPEDTAAAPFWMRTPARRIFKPK